MAENDSATSLGRGLSLLRVLAEGDAQGMRLTEIVEQSGMKQATVHRLLQSLMEEGFVEQGESKAYRLGLDLFGLAARAGNAHGLRDACRPVLLRLSATLSDTIFLMVRSGYYALCLDRAEGPFPIRSFTGDVGGRVPLGIGQGSLAILSYMPEAERDEVIRFNLPRLLDRGLYDEVYLRTEIARVHQLGYAGQMQGLIPGMAGVAVPIFDRSGRIAGALSVGTLLERLNADRLPVVVQILTREAKAIGEKLSPFDPALRRPAQVLGAAASES